MYEDLEILQKLYSLQKSLTDVDEINIIKNLIDKRNVEFDLKGFSDFTDVELSRMHTGVKNAYFEAVDYCIDVYGKDDDDIDDKDYQKTIENMFSEFKLIKLKIHKEKNSSLKKIAQENIKIIMKDQFIKTILKY